jgi:hypothetical protein
MLAKPLPGRQSPEGDTYQIERTKEKVTLTRA